MHEVLFLSDATLRVLGYFSYGQLFKEGDTNTYVLIF